MIPSSVSLSSTGASPWIVIDPNQNAFGVGFNVDLNSTASGITYSVQHTFDRLNRIANATISRTGTTVTVTVPEGHNLSTNDNVVVLNANTITGATGLDGTYDVTVTGTTTFTYTSGTSGTVATFTGIQVILLRVQNNSVVVGATTSIDGNYAFPVAAVRLNISAYIAGTATLTVRQGRK